MTGVQTCALPICFPVTIKKLGTDSYLGPWLRQVKYEVEKMVKSDFSPDICVRNSVVQTEAIINDAKQNAQNIIDKANAEVRRIKKEQDDNMRSEVQRVLRILAQTNKEIDNTICRLQ